MPASKNNESISDHLKNPYDRTFKKLMRHKAIARDMFKQHLPASVLKIIDLNTLSLSKTSYVDPQLHESASDVVYKVKASNEIEAYLYCLCEHQSTPDKRMPLRFLQYTCRIMEDHLAQGHKFLPLVVPILIYNGVRSPYPYSIDLFDQFADKNLAMEVMFKPAQLIDLTAISDDQLLQKKQADVFLKMLLKHMRARDFMPYLEKMLTLLQHLRQNQEEGILEDVLSCIYITTQIADKQRFRDLIKSTRNQKGENIMTLGQQAYNEGVADGVKKGIEEGMADGVKQGMADGVKQGVAQGREQGVAQGREQGVAQGREQGVAQGREQGVAQGREQGVAQGREQGIERGIKQGKAEGLKSGSLSAQRTIAKKMLAEGLNLSLIVKISDLSKEDVISLKEAAEIK